MTNVRGLGFIALFCASIGIAVGQSSMVTLIQGVGVGGQMFFLALTVAFLVGLTNAMAFAELSLMMPRAQSLTSYTEAAMGHFPAILQILVGYLAPTLFATPVELILVDTIISHVLPGVMPPLGWAMLLLVVMAFLNILGADVFARIQTTLALLMFTFLLVASLTVLSGAAVQPLGGGPAAAFLALGAQGGFIASLALAFWMFMGVEFVTSFVTIARNPQRDLPRAMIIALTVAFVLMVMFAYAAIMVLPRDMMLTSPTPHVDFAVAVFGPWARIGFAAVALVGTASLINTLFAALPRMLQGMAINGQAPAIFARVNNRFQTPLFGILFIFCLPVLGLVWSGGSPTAIISLTMAASVTWLVAYIINQISLLILRRRHPNTLRPFRAFGVPVASWVAIAIMAIVIFETLSMPSTGSKIVTGAGVVILVSALASLVWVKVVMKTKLFAPSFAVESPPEATLTTPVQVG